MPIDASIPLGVQTPDATKNLSSLMGIASTAQQMQSTAQQMQGNAQTIQNNAISLNERKAVQNVLSDPSNYTDQDGNIDFNRALPQIMRVAPTTGTKYVQDLMTAQQTQTEAKRSLNAMTTENRTQMGQAIRSIGFDAPPDVVNKTFDTMEGIYKGSKPYVDALRMGYQHALQQGKAPDFLTNAANATMPQPTQVDVASGSLAPLATKGGTVLVQAKTGASTPQGGQVGQTFAPPNQVVTTPSGRFGTVNPAENSYQEPQPAAPTTPAPNLPQGETPDTQKVWQGQRTKANLAAAQVPEEQFNNNQIIKLTKSATMGGGGDILRGLTGHYALAPDAVTTNGTVDYDKLQHFLALQQGSLAERAGFNSDASRSIAEHQSGSATGTPEGVASIARTNRALATGIDLYNRGQENWIKSNGNDVFKGRDFQQAWSHSVDFDALRIYDAAKNAKQDPDGVKAITQELGGVGSKRYQAALQNYDKLLQVIRSGGR